MSHANGHANTGAIVVAPLAKTQPEQSRTFEPGSIPEAFHLASILVKSRLLPDSVQSPEAAFAIIATGRELGLTAMQSLRSIHVIKGKTILSADLVAALVKSRRDVCAYFMLVESTTERATYKTQRVGEPEATTLTFSFDDAKRAQVTGNPNWTKFPAAMLRARCITALARAVYPDLAMGIYDADEIEAAPAPAQPVYEVVPPVGPGPTGVTFTELCDRIDAAATPAELNAAAVRAQRAHKAGELTDEELRRIKVGGKARREALAAPPAPASDPSGYGDNETEAEAMATGGDS